MKQNQFRPDFSLICDQNEETNILKMVATLKENDFDCVQIPIGKDKIVLIRQTNSQRILKTLASLKFEKSKYSKHKICDLGQNSLDKRELKIYKFKEARKNLNKKINEMELFSKFKYGDRNKFLVDQGKKIDDDELLQKVFTSSERELAIYQILANIKIKQNQIPEEGEHYLLLIMKKNGILKDICPISQNDPIKFRHLYNLFYTIGLQDTLAQLVDGICKIFGEQVGMYFYFLLYLLRQMWFLVFFGLFTYILDKIFNENVNTSPFESLYSMITVIWGSIFVGKWNKRQKELLLLLRCNGRNFDYYQNNLNLSLMNCFKHNDRELYNRGQQKNEGQIDPITGIQQQYSFQIKWKQYLISCLKSLPYLITLFCFLIISLNVRGYIIPEHSWIYVNYLNQLSQRDGIFDKQSMWFFLTSVFHVMGVQKINQFYKHVCIITSLKENHDSFHGFEGSVIFKRFAFEMLSGFMDFFYIGLVKFDIWSLKGELLSMFMVDEIRRLLSETILPSITKQRQKRYIQNQIDKQLQQFVPFILSSYLPKYDSFDDYLEIILNFGYVLFFTSAYPLASIVVQIFLVIEFLSDHYKMNHLYQKPISLKTTGISSWSTVMDIISVISVFTSLVLFAFSSDKITQFFPSLFIETEHQTRKNKQATPLEGKGRYQVLLVFIIEHVLLILMWLGRVYINNKKDWTNIYQQRLEYKKGIRAK